MQPRLLPAMAAAAAALLVAAASAPAMRDPAIVIHGESQRCVMAGSDADGNLIAGGAGTIDMIVENGNKVMVTCKGDDLTNLSGSAQSFRGFLCAVTGPESGFQITDDTHATVAANGRGSMNCTYRK